jgi:threonine synthase
MGNERGASMNVDVVCPRCGAQASEPFWGCVSCLREGVSANLTTTYAVDDFREDPERALKEGALLPLADPSPSSRATPLRHVPRLGELLDSPALYLKDESCTQTWSHKDRLASVAVAHAAERGAPVVIVSSSGNHGAAVASACAAAGLVSVVLTVQSITRPLRRLIASAGAHLVALEESRMRWTLMAEAVAELGWYPASNFLDPPPGSNPFGIDGYKLIAWETMKQLGRSPDWVVAPTGYGDLLFGVYKGFHELSQLGLIDVVPRFLAAVTSASLPEALSHGIDQPQPAPNMAPDALSIGVVSSTYQAVHALRASRGSAVAVGAEAAARGQRLLATHTGSLQELSSATGIAALEFARTSGLIHRDDTVVVIGTSSGLKDQELEAELPDLRVIEPTLRSLESAVGPLSTLTTGSDQTTVPYR